MISRSTHPQAHEMADSVPGGVPSGDAGSQPKSEPVFLAVGKLRRPHGVHGEILMDVLTDFPERVQRGSSLYVGPEHRVLRVRSHRWHSNALLISFAGFDTPEQVGELRNQIAYVPAADRPTLPEGEYYHHQLIGLRVVSEQGDLLGKVAEILVTGANDVYVVQPEIGKELLVPAINEFVLAIDLEHGEIQIRLAPGLLPE